MPTRRSASKCHKTVLPNGLTLVTEHDPRFQSVSIGFWVRVGTRHEPIALNGISHFLEHMMFKGTPARSAYEISKSMDQVGGDFNAFTAREHTCFHVSILKDYAPLAFEILTDVLLNSSFSPKEIDREKNVILQEISMVEESPEEKIFDQFFEWFYPNHGMGRPILGTEKTVGAMTRQKLKQFFYNYYCPENIIVSVAGDVSHRKVLEWIRPLVRAQWRGRTKDATIVQNRQRTAKGQMGSHFGVRWMEFPSEQDHVVVGFEAPHYRSSDRLVMAVLNLALGGGMSSRLFQEVREKAGLAYTVYSHFSAYEDTGIEVVYAGVTEGKAAEAIQKIQHCFSSLQKKSISPGEMKMLRDSLKSATLMSLDSVDARMMNIAQAEMFIGKITPIPEILKAIDSVQASEIRALAKRIFDLDHANVVIAGSRRPKKQKDRMLQRITSQFSSSR